jgi:hypothetical protein
LPKPEVGSSHNIAAIPCQLEARDVDGIRILNQVQDDSLRYASVATPVKSPAADTSAIDSRLFGMLEITMPSQ